MVCKPQLLFKAVVREDRSGSLWRKRAVICRQTEGGWFMFLTNAELSVECCCCVECVELWSDHRRRCAEFVYKQCHHRQPDGAGARQLHADHWRLSLTHHCMSSSTETRSLRQSSDHSPSHRTLHGLCHAVFLPFLLCLYCYRVHGGSVV